MSAGPADYSPERSSSIVKPNAPNTDFTKGLARIPEKIDPSNGPGTHNVSNQMSSGLVKKTIGVRRD